MAQPLNQLQAMERNQLLVCQRVIVDELHLALFAQAVSLFFNKAPGKNYEQSNRTACAAKAMHQNTITMVENDVVTRVVIGIRASEDLLHLDQSSSALSRISTIAYHTSTRHLPFLIPIIHT